jgi:hypothetical protein
MVSLAGGVVLAGMCRIVAFKADCQIATTYFEKGCKLAAWKLAEAVLKGTRTRGPVQHPPILGRGHKASQARRTQMNDVHEKWVRRGGPRA